MATLMVGLVLKLFYCLNVLTDNYCTKVLLFLVFCVFFMCFFVILVLWCTLLLCYGVFWVKILVFLHLASSASGFSFVQVFLVL